MPPILESTIESWFPSLFSCSPHYPLDRLLLNIYDGFIVNSIRYTVQFTWIRTLYIQSEELGNATSTNIRLIRETTECRSGGLVVCVGWSGRLAILKYKKIQITGTKNVSKSVFKS